MYSGVLNNLSGPNKPTRYDFFSKINEHTERKGLIVKINKNKRILLDIQNLKDTELNEMYKLLAEMYLYVFFSIMIW